MTHGFVRKETLLGCGIVVVALAILLTVGLSLRRRETEDSDAARLRRLYVAVSLYQESYVGQPPPDLLAAKLFISDTSAYIANGDPYATASGPFPIDGGLPDSPHRSPYRISMAYLWAHRDRLPAQKRNWPLLAAQSQLGFLADEWIGAVEANGRFGANVSGPLLRVDFDGSLMKKGRTGGAKPLGDLGDLFLSTGR